MRKFLLNGAVWSSAFGVIPLLKETAEPQRRTWKTVLQWLAWGISVAVAVATVLDKRDAAREEARARRASK